MMEQREKLIELIQKMYDRFLGTYGGMADFLLANGVVASPCRCKDCKYSNTGRAISDESTWCDYWGIDPDFDDFCSHGERKGSK